MFDFDRLKEFRSDQSGAVTVDWVVLTGLIVGLALIILGTASKGITGAAVNVSADLVTKQIAASNLNK